MSYKTNSQTTKIKLIYFRTNRIFKHFNNLLMRVKKNNKK